MPDSSSTLHEIKISELPVATAANATDQLEANQAGTSRSITVGQIGQTVRYGVSPYAYGGVGNGVADDSAAVAAAIAIGRAVDLSGGTWALNTVSITPSTACPGIFSDGSGIVVAAPGTTLSTSIFVVTKNDFYFDRLFFNLPTSTSPTVSAALSTGIRFSGTGTRARVTNCRIIGGVGNIVIMGSWSDTFVLNNICEQSWGDAIDVAVGGNVTIAGNLVKDGGFSTSLTSGGIRVGYTAADPTPENIVIRDNIIRNFALFGQSSIDCYQPAARNILITGNVCDKNGSGIELKTDNPGGITDNVYQNIIISNNLMRLLNLGATSSVGVAFNSAVNGLPDAKPGKVLVTGNFVSLDAPALSTDSVYGISGATAYSDTEVSNNFILNTARGIQLSASATTTGAAWTDLVINSNNINCSGAGIYLGNAVGTLTSPRVTNNIVAAGAQGLIFNTATVNGATVTGNYITTSGGFAFDMRDTHDTLVKNNVFVSTSTNAFSLAGTASTNIIIDGNDLTSATGNAFTASTGTGIVISNNRITTPAASRTITGAASYLTANNTRGTITASPAGTYAGALGDAFYNGTVSTTGPEKWLCITAGTSAAAVWLPVSGSAFQIAGGAVATPSLSFTTAPLSGLYNSSGNAVAVAANAKPALVVSESGASGNYIQLVSNNGPTVIGNGPTNPPLVLSTGTGTGGVDIKQNNTLNFLTRFAGPGSTTANYFQMDATATTVMPLLSVQGSDTDIDMRIGPKGAGLVRFSTASSIVANGSVAVTMTALGPTGASTTIREWLAIKNSSGATRYIPLY